MSRVEGQKDAKCKLKCKSQEEGDEEELTIMNVCMCGVYTCVYTCAFVCVCV